jgi:hypothetical protein
VAWTHLATAPDELTATMWVQMLRDCGIAAAIHPSDSVSFLGMSAGQCRVQVAEEQLELARDLLGEADASDRS